MYAPWILLINRASQQLSPKRFQEIKRQGATSLLSVLLELPPNSFGTNRIKKIVTFPVQADNVDPDDATGL